MYFTFVCVRNNLGHCKVLWWKVMESRLLSNMAFYSLLAGFCKVNLCRSGEVETGSTLSSLEEGGRVGEGMGQCAYSSAFIMLHCGNAGSWARGRG